MGDAEVTERPEPDSSDTASWLVEEMVARGAEPAASPAGEEEEDWELGEPGDPEEDLGYADEDPDDDELDDELPVYEDEDEGGEPDLAAVVGELRRDLARATVDLDRLSGRIAAEVTAQLDQRQDELALRGSARASELKGEIATAEERVAARVDGAVAGERERSERELGAIAAQLRLELGEAEKRLGTQFVDEIRSHVKAMERKREALTEAVAGFSGRLDGLERRLRAVAEETSGIQQTLAVVARYRAHARADEEEAPRGGLDLNRASFEDLRRVGLSATQAARVLSHRDAAGGYDSVERLREVPGLPDKLVDRITPRVRT